MIPTATANANRQRDMPKQETYNLHPTGWENDASEERFKLSTMDYLVACVYVSYAIFFRINDDANKPKVASLLKQGLEKTLSQTRHLCGVIEQDPEGGHSFVKQKDSTVQYVVQYLDGSEDQGKYPSFTELEKAHFASKALGDLDTYSVAPMTYGEKPEAMLDNRPKVASFKATFVPGGLIFMMHHHHTANDVMGWAGVLHQLAENCAAISKGTEFPPWDPSCLDLSLFTREDCPKEQQVDGPPPPQKHPDHKKSAWMLFHLSKSKAAALKELASPADGSYWISTYDAYEAFIWRVLSRHRAKLYNPDPSSCPLWGEAVDMRKRCHSPPVPARIQHNVVGVALSAQAAVPPLTVAEIIADAPLRKLAWFIRQMTNSTTQEGLNKTLDAVAPVRDKSVLCLRCDSFPPMYNFVTDWRDTNVCAADFGFGKPHAFRHIMNFVTPGLMLVYPPRTDDPASDEGPEFCIAYEQELLQGLTEDAEWCKYFEFRGVDSGDSE